VKVASGGSATVYVGSTYETVTTTGVTTYYYLGSQRVAMRTSAGVTWLAGDHLGSASLATNSAGQRASEQRYYPYGATRVVTNTMPTDYQFTGQKLDGGTGLYFYGARYYDPVTGRFVSADTIVPSPGKPQALNRYSYVYNNPMRYVDPTGMFTEDELLGWGITQEQIDYWKKNDKPWWAIVAAVALGDKVTATHCHSCLNGTVGVEGYFAQLPTGWEGQQRLVMTGFEHGITLESFRGYSRNQELWHDGDKVETPRFFMSPARPDTRAEFWKRAKSAVAPVGDAFAYVREFTKHTDPLTPNELTGSGLAYDQMVKDGAAVLAPYIGKPGTRGGLYAGYLLAFSAGYDVIYDNATGSGPLCVACWAAIFFHH
jgi:RHS repeat-associated protein